MGERVGTDIFMPTDKKALRKTNLQYTIWREGPISRGDLARLVHLNLPTISTLISELMAEQEIVEEGFATSTGGRRPQLLDVNPEVGHVIGVSFVTRGISSAHSNLKGVIENRQDFEFDPSLGRDQAIKRLKEAVRAQIESLTQRGGRRLLRQIGIGISGLVDKGEGISREFPRFESWADVPLREILEKEFDVPVVIDNNVATITLAELIFGDLRHHANALYVHLGSGIGSGIVIDGKVYKGSRSYVGEFGHVTVAENGPVCYCGNYGCLEAVASEYALIQQAESARREGVHSSIYGEKTSTGAVKSDAIFRAAENGDRLATRLVEKACSLMGTGIAALINLFGPEAIILGGPMAQAGDIMLTPLRRSVLTQSLDRIHPELEIRVSGFGNNAGLMGAITLALHNHYTAAGGA
jgi:predicted NBD/HSP70 family sugar kinase